MFHFLNEMLVLEHKHPYFTFHDLEYLLVYAFACILKKLYIENAYACGSQVYTCTFAV